MVPHSVEEMEARMELHWDQSMAVKMESYSVDC